MERHDVVRQRIKEYYWNQDLNCATTTLRILAETFDVDLSPQVLDAALGMHGAGEYGAQCGLVEGTLLFIGIIGRARRMPDAAVVLSCRRFAEQFEGRFSSLLCRVLRPEGFRPDNPPHLCEPLTYDAVCFSVAFVARMGQ